MALNEMQQQAVECTEGPLLILAGAGSGKTTVLVNRVQHIIESELARPWEILAITFTNKAAGEISGKHMGAYLSYLLRKNFKTLRRTAGLQQPFHNL